MEKSEKVLLLSSIILVGFTFGVIYHYILGFYLDLGDPYNSFLFGASSALGDFSNVLPFIKDLNPYQEPTIWINYFPLAYILMFPFTLFKDLLIAYIVFAACFLSFLIFMNIKNFTCSNLTKIQNTQNIIIISLISYPVLYLLDKGNFDMYLFVLFALFVYSFKSEKYFLSAFILAIENAFKPFFIVFLILFLFKKKFKEFFLSIILTILMIVGGFLFLKGAFFNQIITLIKSLMLFKSIYVYQDNNSCGLFFCSSLFSLLKLVFCKLTSAPIVSFSLFAQIYSYLCFVITAFTIFFIWKEKVFWKQITLLVCNMLLIPYVTFDYKLIFLFVPIWLFVNENFKSKFDLAYTILFALLLIPKNIVITRIATSITAAKWFSLSIIINPLILIAISGLIIFEQFYLKRKLD